MCTFVIMYMYIPEYTLIFENFKGGGGGACAPHAPSKSASGYWSGTSDIFVTIIDLSKSRVEKGF